MIFMNRLERLFLTELDRDGVVPTLVFGTDSTL